MPTATDMRVILDPVLKPTVSYGDGYTIYREIESAFGQAIRRSITMDVRPFFVRMHADMTVRPFTDPLTGTERWALVVDNDDVVIMRDFPAKRHAIRFYEQLARDLSADHRAIHGDRAHVWDFSDVTGVPTNGRHSDGW
ncbi:MAG: hypothetical protein ACTHOG_12730 [Marmoricola sp.]|jgi:hypothetical protein